MNTDAMKSGLTPMRTAMSIALEGAYKAGYAAAIDDAASRMEMIAAVLPSSVTKAKLIQLCADEAMGVRARSNKQ